MHGSSQSYGTPVLAAASILRVLPIIDLLRPMRSVKTAGRAVCSDAMLVGLRGDTCSVRLSMDRVIQSCTCTVTPHTDTVSFIVSETGTLSLGRSRRLGVAVGLGAAWDALPAISYLYLYNIL